MALHLLAARVVCCVFLMAVLFTSSALAEMAVGDTPLTVSEGKTISMEYTLTLEDNNVVDTNVGKDPLKFTQGKHQIIPGLEAALEGMKKGETKQVTVSPDQAYGTPNPQAVQEVPIDKIPEAARKVGATLQGKDAQGRMVHPRVTEIKDQVVVLDFNHPLAGKTLNFDVKIIDIENAKTP